MPRNRLMTARVEVEHLGHVEYEMAGPYERFGQHLVPKRIEVTFPGDSSSPSLGMVLQIEDGAATCRELRLVAKEGQRGVHVGDLRSIRLNEWIEDLFAGVAQRAATQETSPGSYTITFSEPDQRAAAEAMRNARKRGARRKITDAFLAEVAAVHRSAPRAPTQAVADHFGKQHRTASLYIAKARERGLLTEED